MIQIFNVVKMYDGSNPVLDDISFEIPKGEFVFLTGPSGAGKTTILKILFGWESFEKGQVLVQGINVGKLTHRNVYTLRRSMGVVFQDYKLLPNKTVFENVSFAQEVIGHDRKTIRFKTWEALKNVGLTPKKDVYPAYLSGGEQQRIAIARAMVNSPSIILPPITPPRILDGLVPGRFISNERATCITERVSELLSGVGIELSIASIRTSKLTS